MSIMEPNYFVAEGRSYTAVSALLEERERKHKERQEWAEANGGIGYYGDDRSFLGIISKLKDIPGWMMKFEDPQKGEFTLIPDPKHLRGKGFMAAMHKLGVVPGPMELTKALADAAKTHVRAYVGRDPRSGQPLVCSCGKVGGKLIVSVPFNAPGVPPDAVPLLRSEYWKMVEDEASSGEKSVTSLLLAIVTAYRETQTKEGFDTYKPVDAALAEYDAFLVAKATPPDPEPQPSAIVLP